MTSWAEVEVGGQFAITAPTAAGGQLNPEGTTFILRLPTDPVTELLISRHSLAGSAPLTTALRSCIERFFSQCVPGCRLPASIEAPIDAALGDTILQGVAFDQDDTCWLVRAIGLPEGRDYYWLQWCGPGPQAKHSALRTFMSFRTLST